MIVELVGPMGIGKTTVAPLVAERLGIAYYRGQGFHGLDDSPLTGLELWADRILSVARRPRLAWRSARAHGGSINQRLGFALNTCRRDRFEARAASAGDGVVESGPVHAICQMGAWIERDLTPLAADISTADVYVRMSADPAEVIRRLDSRRQLPPEYIARHGDWIERYDKAVDMLLAQLARPVVDVDAGRAPDQVAADIAARVKSLIT